MDRTKLLSLIATLGKQRSGFVPDRPIGKGKGKDRTWRESKRHKSQMSRSHRRKK